MFVEEIINVNAIPKEFICPITKKIFYQPVKAKDGNVYEKEVIEQCIKNTDKSPISNQRLYLTDLQEDIPTKIMIEEYLERHSQHQAEVYLPDKDRKALLEALEKQNIETIKVILKKDERFYLQPLEKGRNIFQLACEIGSSKILSELLEFLKNEKMLETMMQAKKPDDWKPTRLNEKLLFWTKAGTAEEVKMALDLGADIRIETTTKKNLIHIAAEGKKIDTLKLLLNLGLSCSVDEGQARPLIHIAAESHDDALIGLVLGSKISIDVRNANGFSVLHKAIISKNDNEIKYFLDKGANPNLGNSVSGNTSLHLALQHNLSEEIVVLLIQKGAYYKERNSKGERPIDLISNNLKLLYAMERAHKGEKQVEKQKLFTRINFLEEKIKSYESQEQEKIKIEEPIVDIVEITQKSLSLNQNLK